MSQLETIQLLTFIQISIKYVVMCKTLKSALNMLNFLLGKDDLLLGCESTLG